MENLQRFTVALFGEAEKGAFQTAYYLRNLDQLVEYLGNPPPQSLGLFYAVQALLYDRNLIFFRVREEGYSKQDYLYGLEILENQCVIPEITAFCLPGVGDSAILRALNPVCAAYHSILITNEADLYDYLTNAA